MKLKTSHIYDYPCFSIENESDTFPLLWYWWLVYLNDVTEEKSNEIREALILGWGNVRQQDES